MRRAHTGHKLATTTYPNGIRASNDQTHYSIPRSLFFEGDQTRAFDLGTNAAYAVYPVTIEAGVYSNGTSGGLVQLQNPTSGQFTIYSNQGVTQSDRLNATASAQTWTNFSSEAWHHIAFTMWSSTASTSVADRITWWLDGVSNGVTQGGAFSLSSGTPNYTATGETRLLLGIQQYSLVANNSPFNGFISEIRVSNNARYGTTSTTFTPPAAAMTSDANTLLLAKVP